MLENIVEKTCRDYATARGWVAKKFTSPSNRGVHDHIFFKNGHTFTVEFKAPGKRATKLQSNFADEMTAAGIPCRCIDQVYKGKMFIDEMTRHADAHPNDLRFYLNTESFK